MGMISADIDERRVGEKSVLDGSVEWIWAGTDRDRDRPLSATAAISPSTDTPYYCPTSESLPSTSERHRFRQWTRWIEIEEKTLSKARRSASG